MQLGRFTIDAFVERRFRLDGGTMFGVIPKSMWAQWLPPDENNLVPMRTNLFVLRAHGKTILFDAGFGDGLTEREEKIYAPETRSDLDRGLAALGVSPDEIDFVVLTHLHTDHAAGAVRREGDSFVPRFANATVVASRVEYEAAVNPNERTRAAYVPERYLTLQAAGCLELIGPRHELLPGITLVHTGGHSEGHFAVEVESEGHTFWYCGDMYPSSHHLAVPYVPAVDLFPLTTMNVKRHRLNRLIDEAIILGFSHDTRTAMARIARDGRRFIVEPIESSAGVNHR